MPRSPAAPYHSRRRRGRGPSHRTSQGVIAACAQPLSMYAIALRLRANVVAVSFASRSAIPVSSWGAKLAFSGESWFVCSELDRVSVSRL